MRIVLHRFLVVTCAVVVLAVFPSTGIGSITCGQLITEDTLLTTDLTCPASISTAITIIASNVTLNLGGHTLKSQGGRYGVFIEGWRGIERVRITNGTIEGFGTGIAVFNSRDVTVHDIAMKNGTGVHLHRSQNVLVEDSSFVSNGMAVIQYESKSTIRNIDSQGGMVAVNFFPVCDNSSSPNNSAILDSTFSNVPTAVWVACTNNTRISGNTFTDCINPIQGDAPFPGAVTGLVVENNVIHTTVSPSLGIQFRGVTNSTVSNNFVQGNDAWGITIGQSVGCTDPLNNPGWECFYSTNNLIKDNIALENGIDLHHDAASSPNTWENNACITAQGADIPPCERPEAARTAVPLAAVDAVRFHGGFQAIETVASHSEVSAYVVPPGVNVLLTDLIISNPNTSAACCAEILGDNRVRAGPISVPAEDTVTKNFMTGIGFTTGTVIRLRNDDDAGPLHFTLRGYRFTLQ